MHREALAACVRQFDAAAKPLCTVLNQRHAFAFGDGAQGGEVGGQAEEIDGYHGLGPEGHVVVYRADGVVQALGIHVEGAGVNIDKDRCGPFERHHFGCGEEGEVGHKGGVAFAHPKGFECEGEGIRAVGTGKAVFHAHIFS